MFKNIVEELEKLKRRLTWQAWTQGASSLHDKVQYESLFQGFRVVGTITKDGGRCRAFSVGEKVTVEYLNKFVPEDHRAVSFVYKSDYGSKMRRRSIQSGISGVLWRSDRGIHGLVRKQFMTGGLGS